MKKLYKKSVELINQKTLVGEILRFIIVGAIATAVDFFAMGVTKYILQPQIYPSFISVFLTFINGIHSAPYADTVGTGVGFVFGLVANYLLSVIFVFNEEGNSKTFKGAIKFIIFSFIGLLIHEVGMLTFTKFTPVNEWIVKVLMTIIVLVYNYLTRKIFIFKSAPNATDNVAPDAQQDVNEINGGAK